MESRKVTRKVAHGIAPAIFAVSGVAKLADPATPAQFERWGYPHWWGWLTGATELVTAGLLSDRRTATLGAALGTAVLSGAFSTHVRERELGMLAVPVVTGALMVGSWLAWQGPRAPKAAREGFPAQLDAERRALEGTSNREP